MKYIDELSESELRAQIQAVMQDVEEVDRTKDFTVTIDNVEPLSYQYMELEDGNPGKFKTIAWDSMLERIQCYISGSFYVLDCELERLVPSKEDYLKDAIKRYYENNK